LIYISGPHLYPQTSVRMHNPLGLETLAPIVYLVQINAETLSMEMAKFVKEYNY